MLKNLFLLIRPHQWIKNFFIFMPVFFGGALTDSAAVTDSIVAFFAYSFAASAIYCLNDIVDVEDDRRHTVKCRRPIASGAVSVAAAVMLMALMLTLSAATAVTLASRWQTLLGVIGVYLVLDIAYCLMLKRFAVVDVAVLAAGFVLRIMAGSAATGILASHWLVLMTFLLTLLMGLAKRRDDVARFAATGIPPRHNTKRYNMAFISQAITVTAAVTLVCYIMYTLSPEVIARTGCQYLYLTTVFVILGILRYMQLTSVDGKSGDPTHLLYHDRFLQTDIVLWLLTFLCIIYVK